MSQNALHSQNISLKKINEISAMTSRTSVYGKIFFKVTEKKSSDLASQLFSGRQSLIDTRE